MVLHADASVWLRLRVEVCRSTPRRSDSAVRRVITGLSMRERGAAPWRAKLEVLEPDGARTAPNTSEPCNKPLSDAVQSAVRRGVRA